MTTETWRDQIVDKLFSAGLMLSASEHEEYKTCGPVWDALEAGSTFGLGKKTLAAVRARLEKLKVEFPEGIWQRSDMICGCGSVLSAVTGTCVRADKCQILAETANPPEDSPVPDASDQIANLSEALTGAIKRLAEAESALPMLRKEIKNIKAALVMAVKRVGQKPRAKAK